MAQKIKQNDKEISLPGVYSEVKAEEPKEMTLEEAKAYRKSLAKQEHTAIPEADAREEFRLYWAVNKASYGQGKDIEPIIWTHLKAIGKDHPSQFEQGIQHFGLQKVK